MMHYLLLSLSEKEYISIKIPCLEPELYRYDDSFVSFKDDKNNVYDLLDDYLIEALSSLDFVLEKACHNELEIHNSIDKDIGILRNDYFQDRGQLVYATNSEGHQFWIGNLYNIWSSSRDCKTHCDTWLYQKNGKTYFEITPLYPWNFDEPQEEESYFSYDEFINNYKPYIIRELPQETVQEWANKVKRWLKIIHDNDARYLKPIYRE